MTTPCTADVEACARRINEGRSTNHHAFIVLQAYSPPDADDISPEHEAQLIKLGWFVNGSVDSWAIFT